MLKFKVDFQPLGRRDQLQESESLLDCARRLNIGINNVCGGSGVCGKCRVKVISGVSNELTEVEKGLFSPQEIKVGWRIACQLYAYSDLQIYIPPESMTTSLRMQLEGLETQVPVEPLIKNYQVEVPHPLSLDHRENATLLLTELNDRYKLNCNDIDNLIVKMLPDQPRNLDSQVQMVVRDREVIAISQLSNRRLGLAVDLGSTKIAGYLVDLDDGKTLAAKGIMNPQITYGEDIISRISAVSRSHEAANELKTLANKAVNTLVHELCNEIGASNKEIVEAVLVGNTAMHHLFLGLPVKQLALYPFSAAECQEVNIKARELDIQLAPGAYVHILPNIAKFIGADHVAALLATEVYHKTEPVIVIDIGTNTEVALVYKGKITAASCASGPVFEGGHIKDGMRAAGGAIEKVRITNEKVEYQTIDDTSPIGICGSGILDTIAQLLLNKAIDGSGRMNENHPKVQNIENRLEFILVENDEQQGNPTISFTQEDVRQIQLGKAAIRTGIQILLEENNCDEEEIKEVIIAGAFGSYIDVSNAMVIGMLPTLPLDRFQQVGNAAGMGAKRALISRSQRRETRKIAEKVQHIELSTTTDFNKIFIQNNFLGKYSIKQGEREDLS